MSATQSLRIHPLFIFSFCVLHLACALLFVPPAFSWPVEGWEQIETDHTALRFRGPDQTFAENLTFYLQSGYRHVHRKLGLGEDIRTIVYLAPSARLFEALTSGAVPDWGVGCAFPEHRVIVLRKVEGTPGALRETIYHEISHILLNNSAGDLPIPRWFDEGMAMWNASEWRWGQSYEMSAAAVWGNLLPLREIDNVLAFASPKAKLAYAESFSAVSFLMRQEGPDIASRLLTDLRSGYSFEEAFARQTGATTEEFEERWRKEAEKRFGLAALLSESINFWLGVTMLFLLAYVATKLRNRRKIRQWEADEAGPSRPALQIHHGRPEKAPDKGDRPWSSE